MTREPTQAEIREFWEWCGLKVVSEAARLSSGLYILEAWRMPDGEINFRPALDLNNLFKYAVPKADIANWYTTLRSHVYSTELNTNPDYEAALSNGSQKITAHEEDPALALFRALQGIKWNGQ